MGKLDEVWRGVHTPFLIHHGIELRFSQIASENPVDLSTIRKGDVVALIGDYSPSSLLTLFRLIDLQTIVVPLTILTTPEHEYFFDAAHVDVVIDGAEVKRRAAGSSHPLLDELRLKGHAGLIVFSTGTTGRPKAILHDMTLFLRKFETPRPTLRTINFLLFDHMGGLNTLFHTLFNKGVVVAPEARTVDSILESCERYAVEALPTTPTFLRMMLMSGVVPDKVPASLKVITYGTERMDQPTLDELCRLLPKIDFRQTFGMSELGVVRVKSEARNSLFMKIGGEGIKTRVVDNVLQIHSQSRMLGYLNAPSPFDEEGWYDANDVVEEKDGFFKIVGRVSEVINVGGLKFMASEVERVALQFPDVALVKVYPVHNPITGQHVEITVQPTAPEGFDKTAFLTYLKTDLRPHMVPKRVRIETVGVGHRFKRI
ncbi:long-chain fatty acid--CoA ligase [Methylocystis sp.]